MDSKWIFHKCFCCCKNFNVAKLIEINENLNENAFVVIGDEAIDLKDLLLDVCLAKVDSSKVSYICDECKSQLVMFHVFKRDVKKYSSFQQNMLNIQILSKVEELLKDFDNLSTLNVVRKENFIVISPRNAAYPSNTEYSTDVSSEVLENYEAIEECIEESIDTDNFQYEISEYKPLVEEIEVMSEVCEESKIQEESEEESRPKRQGLKKYKYPVNTNEKLADEEKDWINQKVKECEFESNGKTLYKCPLCDLILHLPATFKKHLRDIHILKSEEKQENSKIRRRFRDEIDGSRLTAVTSRGPENIWKCQRCINRIFRSEAGLKTHIRTNHIRSTVIDVKFVARCKIEIETEQGLKNAWKCPECEKILRSRDALRNHMKMGHADVLEGSQMKTQTLVASNDCFVDKTEDILNVLESKKRHLKTALSVNGSCLDCGIEFIKENRKIAKTLRIHGDCHNILSVISNYYELPKCEITRTVFINDEALNYYLENDKIFMPIPCSGMIANYSRKVKDVPGNASPEGNEAWRCGHCGALYKLEVECKAHIMILHSSNLICPFDHMTFEGNRGMALFRSHMINKHNEKFPDFTFSCTYCQKEFSTIFEKLEHMKNCYKKKYQCDHCGKRYFTRSELLRHLKLVSGEISYICDICSKNCSSTMDLKLHQAAHTNIKSYACSFPDCMKAFKTPAARSAHMEKHSDVNHICKVCLASFKQRILLQRHLKKGTCKASTRDDLKTYEIVEEIQMIEDTECSA